MNADATNSDRRTGAGYVAAWVGAVVGSAVLAYSGFFLGGSLGEVGETGWDAFAKSLTYAVEGLFLGAWLGASVGAWVGLRLRGYGNAAATGLLLSGLVAVGLLLWWNFLQTGNDVVFITFPLIAAAAAPLVARRLTRGRPDPERSDVS